jgi:hypothetical protein
MNINGYLDKIIKNKENDNMNNKQVMNNNIDDTINLLNELLNQAKKQALLEWIESMRKISNEMALKQFEGVRLENTLLKKQEEEIVKENKDLKVQLNNYNILQHSHDKLTKNHESTVEEIRNLERENQLALQELNSSEKKINRLEEEKKELESLIRQRSEEYKVIIDNELKFKKQVGDLENHINNEVLKYKQECDNLLLEKDNEIIKLNKKLKALQICNASLMGIENEVNINSNENECNDDMDFSEKEIILIKNS